MDCVLKIANYCSGLRLNIPLALCKDRNYAGRSPDFFDELKISNQELTYEGLMNQKCPITNEPFAYILQKGSEAWEAC
jgi:hypothetical protein